MAPFISQDGVHLSVLTLNALRQIQGLATWCKQSREDINKFKKLIMDYSGSNIKRF